MKLINKIAILSISFLTLIATIAISPSLTGIQSSFIGTPKILIQFVVTLPALICIPVNLVSNIFLKKISRKNLAIIGIIIYLIGGLLSILAPNIYVLLLTRAILGIGLGILAPLCFIIIGDFFTGTEKAKFTGLSSATTNLGGIISTLIVGYLTSFGWRFSFAIYLISIIPLILVMFFLPCDNKKTEFLNIEKESLIEIKQEIKQEIKLNKSIFKYVIIILLALIAFYSLPTGIAFLFKAKHIGGASLASEIISLSTIASLISSVLFSKLFTVLKQHISIMVFVLLTIGFLLIAVSSSISLIIIGTIFIGIGFGSIFPYSLFYGPNIVHPNHAALSITLLSTGVYLGEFISPVIL
ncbi:MAG: MFS transporter, partial [Clostridium sp.]|uniref:MFS transporter n=1 Tax=Clostridium sp. TaxID=1506 RepID=UPI003EE78733